MEYYAAPAEAVLKELRSTAKGISVEEAKKRLEQHGPNELKEIKKVSPIGLFIEQFKNFIVWILIAAVVISIFLGDYIESVVILIILVLNAVIGFFQEYRAEKAIDALKRLTGLKAEVLRNGERTSIDAKLLVPGDILVLEVGQKIPADARILEAVNLETQEASLTGESTPVRKQAEAMKTGVPIAEQHDMVFSGTAVTKGRGKAVVSQTGMQTEIGRIAKLIEEAEEDLTPLQMKLEKFAKHLGYAVIAIAFIVFFATVWRGGQILEMFETAVSLAVAAIPEGLPAIVAVSLALGVQRMIKKNALVRKLPSVETLGSTTVICTDKTGTLTKDQMTVRKVYVDEKVVDVSGNGYSVKGSFSSPVTAGLKLLLKAGVLCNDALLKQDEIIRGDPTEAALLVSAAKTGMTKENMEKTAKRVDEIPFDSERKRMSTVHAERGKRVLYTKGAPDLILGLCDRIMSSGKIKKLTPSEKKGILQQNEAFAQNALRVLGFAYKPLAAKEKPAEKNLVFIGLQAMIDPPRDEVKDAIKACHDAGIKVVMITGDHKLTAVSIANELGITGKVLTGQELDLITNLEDIVDDVAVYARVSPEHKIKIVHALKKRNHIAAMTGDGVNDAPALKEADIGIAMGKTGTDVAREASKMILTDDNFTSIVNSVEEGRAIYDNIRKFIFFLLSSNIAEVLVIFIAILIGMPLPLVAIQILWMNLVTDGLPALALGVEPMDRDVMKRKPQMRGGSVVDKITLIRMLLMGVVITAGTLGVYIWSLFSHGWHWGVPLGEESPAYIYALTMTFATIVIFEMFNALNAKSETKNVIQSGLFRNKWLLAAIASSVALQLLVMYGPLDFVFHTMPLSWYDWSLILGVTATVMVVDAIYKLVTRKAEAA